MSLNPSDLSPLEDRNELRSVLTAVSAIKDDGELTKRIYRAVAKHAPHVEIQGIEATPDGVFRVKDSNRFEAVANVYVIVSSGKSGPAGRMSNTFPAYVVGHFSPKGAVILDDVSLEQSSPII